MTQTWHDVLFVHWALDPGVLRPKVPAALELDLLEDRAWIGVVPFRMSNVSPRGVPPLPGLSAFPELNVRTYVRVGGRPGVFFFSLDAASRLAVMVARAAFGLPYHAAEMRVEEQGGFIHYRSRRRRAAPAPATLAARYRPTGPVFEPAAGTREHFLTERYCLYIVDRGGRPRMLDIHHPPWPLQAAEAAFEAMTMTAPLGVPLPPVAPLLHFARRQDVVIYPMGPV